MSDQVDEIIAKLRCALAEEGYSDLPMRPASSGSRVNGLPVICYDPDARVPLGVIYRAARIVYGEPFACWSCWLDSRIERCQNGDCAAPPTAPKMPPRTAAVPA